jgi:hypothetical protein
VDKRDEIVKELQAIAPRLATLEKTNVYRTPEGYFAAFNSQIIAKIHAAQPQAELETVAPELSKIYKTDIAAPAGYFSSFSGSVIQKIRAAEVKAELEAIAPTLAKLEKVNAYQAPANYFQSLPEGILGKIEVEAAPENTTGGFISSINNWMDNIFSSILKPRYTVAFAGFATLLIIVGMLFMKIEQCNDLDCKMAQLSNEEIDGYLSSHFDAGSTGIFEPAEENSYPEIDTKNIHPYNDALKDIDDATLNAALQD